MKHNHKSFKAVKKYQIKDPLVNYRSILKVHYV